MNHIQQIEDSFGRYFGEVKNGVRNGKGIYYGKDGTIVYGEWINSRMNGQGGWLTTALEYEGQFKDNVFEGKGRIRYPDGTVYEEDFKDGKISGKYTNPSLDGSVYEGELKDGKKCGKGVWKSSTGEVYEGEFKDDKFEGKGTMKYANGDVYEGEWKNGKREGKGSMVFVNGDTCEGNWKDDTTDGVGVFNYSSGEIYEGKGFDHPKNFEHNSKLSDGSKGKDASKSASFEERMNKKCASGGISKVIKVKKGETEVFVVYFPSGSVFEVDPENNRISGQSTIKYPNGHYYRLNIKNHHSLQTGIFSFSKGTVENEILDSNHYEGTATVTIEDGTRLKVKFKDDVMTVLE